MQAIYCRKQLYIFLLLHCFCIFSKNKISDFKLGVENISDALLIKMSSDTTKKNTIVGLITNQTGVDQKNKRTIDILLEKGIAVKYIFAPEHGLNGTLAERDVHDSIDKKTNIPIISLYGNGSGKMILPEHMNAIDVLIFDIQDSGMRHYTYISTLLNTMKIAAEHQKPFVVFDRPNPLGSSMQGPLVESDLLSFISIASIPLRHGMTIGELAHYFNLYVLEKPISLQVVPMQEYERERGFMGHFIHPLSPNLLTLQSCYGYSLLGILGEVSPFDIGIGTPMAFRCITLPISMNISQDVWKRLQAQLKLFNVKSVSYRHTNPKNNRKSKGLRLEFSDISHLRSFELLITILEFFKQEKIPLSFSNAFNKAVGTAKVQEVLSETISRDIFLNDIKTELENFHKKAQFCFLYQPQPII